MPSKGEIIHMHHVGRSSVINIFLVLYVACSDFQRWIPTPLFEQLSWAIIATSIEFQKIPPKNKEQQQKPFQGLKKEISQSTSGMWVHPFRFHQFSQLTKITSSITNTKMVANIVPVKLNCLEWKLMHLCRKDSECGKKGVKRQFLVILVKEVLEGKWKTSGCLAMLSFRNEYCFSFFLRHIFMCGHFNAVLPSEMVGQRPGQRG